MIKVNYGAMVALMAMLTGCASGEQDVDSEQYLSAWYCLVCAGMDAGGKVEAHQSWDEVHPTINRPEKAE